MKMKFKQRSIKISMVSAILAGTIGLSSASFATNFDVITTVDEACTIGASDMDFGTYETTADSPTQKTSTITLTCTSGTTGTVLISQGGTLLSDSNEAAPMRQMAIGSDTLRYSLSHELGGAEWGNTIASGKGFSGSSNITVYGEIEAGLAVVAGDYEDTVTVSIEY